MTQLLRGELMRIWNQEEQSFLSGDPDGGTNPTYAVHDPFSSDLGFHGGLAQ